MAETARQSILIDAPPDRVAEVIRDFPRYPEWVSAMRSARVTGRGDDGLATEVCFVLDVGVFADEYTLRYSYSEDLGHIEWCLTAPSQTQKEQNGSYDIVPGPDGGSMVTYTLSIELSIAMLGMMKRKAQKMIMDSALRDLKRRVESLEPR